MLISMNDLNRCSQARVSACTIRALVVLLSIRRKFGHLPVPAPYPEAPYDNLLLHPTIPKDIGQARKGRHHGVSPYLNPRSSGGHSFDELEHGQVANGINEEVSGMSRLQV
jgi:hypothetical protein